MSTAAAVQQNQDLSFRTDLIHPPQPQVAHYADSVADRIVRLDISAQRMAEGFGISFTSFVLNPVERPAANDSASLVLAALREFTHKEERITLERRNGRWGLYYSRADSLVRSGQSIEPMPLRDAPLDVRERFLIASEEFFRQYLQLCEQRLGRMKSSIGAADRTIELLANVRLT